MGWKTELCHTSQGKRKTQKGVCVGGKERGVQRTSQAGVPEGECMGGWERECFNSDFGGARHGNRDAGQDSERRIYGRLREGATSRMLRMFENG
jgi:hypothetical protein